jgi:hypothetical protein
MRKIGKRKKKKVGEPRVSRALALEERFIYLRCIGLMVKKKWW